MATQSDANPSETLKILGGSGSATVKITRVHGTNVRVVSIVGYEKYGEESNYDDVFTYGDECGAFRMNLDYHGITFFDGQFGEVFISPPTYEEVKDVLDDVKDPTIFLGFDDDCGRDILSYIQDYFNEK